ncbi:hypothetical protein COV53_03140 [Candidatus Gottesmanbacteria bacterium CG11_big_fil_rev_8_21_14_0_20_37_11]|uniref:Penicillin-binding protein 2 n=2 Tax=Candidatus Gottesmaniibacteriota TaxID=1752720 RepID=A0A2M7RRL5_9BACT|nr:MAG: hypothetical protein COX23_04150 [Candidatus Gottesmanbacteria bacterium CG23_combo_of_CG06-09_8_20_14_all_37_19]PIR08422.1 MAG: hypothetical protein COV53_03140 [Candidatus Gottesmanbacteria bacterium CG11_big_fil_rev_8_21_14_0_20_37_11]PIZ02926.1 MAG: hypothetical protein COY59_02255 [Candidatus Gottesmanbacteria bacterium CG_4_10_14_0_8_um_filter_37_24]
MENRIKIVFYFSLLLFLAIILRLFSWQVTSSETLEGLSERQTLTTFSIPAKRGKIFASDGKPLVINQRAFLVYAEPNNIKDFEKTSQILAKDLDIPFASISAKISDRSLAWVPLAHKVDEQIINKLKNKNLDGLGFLEESKRYYPEASMAAHILGFVGKNSKGEDQGYFGIEGYYNEQLKGRDGQIRKERDAQGNTILSGKITEIPAEDGRDLTLTIDKTVQYIAEKKLQEGVEKYGAKGGTVLILEPFSGAVIAAVSLPAYDPQKYNNYSNEFYKNPSIASTYEPGSTFKVLIMAAALNEGKINLDTKIEENGPIEIGGYKINTWNQKYHGIINPSQVLEYSSNVGMVIIEKLIGSDKLLNYLNDFGFGSLTGIDLQEEASPNLRSKNKWYEIDFATVSFGQGIAVTPLQMVKAVSAIANGGKIMKPYVVKKIKLPSGELINIEPKVEKEIFSKETSRIVSEMMVSAVENGETRFIEPLGYYIAGKTGTAQIPIKGHYDEDKTIASFIGFAPISKPRFVMLVTMREPTASPWGSETAAPVFFNIAKELFTYYGISSSE